MSQKTLEDTYVSTTSSPLLTPRAPRDIALAAHEPTPPRFSPSVHLSFISISREGRPMYTTLGLTLSGGLGQAWGRRGWCSIACVGGCCVASQLSGSRLR